MAKTVVDQFVETPEGMRAFQQERAIYEVTERIEECMEDRGVSRSELATRLGKTKGWVTQLLDGESNKTIRTVADVFAVLGREIHFQDEPIQIGKPDIVELKVFGEQPWEDNREDWAPEIVHESLSAELG